jgi:GT2 family glycosyltransferase
MPKISIVIPTCGDYLDFKRCIESINKYTDMSDKEFVVVANGSDKELIPYVKSLGSNFKLIWKDDKVGVAGAFNLGCKEATGDFIVLINDDLVILEQPKNEWIDRLLAPFEDEIIGITGHITRDGITGIQFVISFCMMIRRKLFDSIGYFDEIFNPYFGEDIDFNIRALRAGWKFGYANINIYHAWETHRAQHPPELLIIINEKIGILRKRYL